MRTRWISPQIVATNRMHEPGYDEVKEMGRRVSAALGIGTAPTHMEWFFGPQGPALLRDRLPAARGRAVGQLLRRQRVRPLPRMGAGGLPRRHRPAAVAPLRLRHHRAAPRPRRPHRRLRGRRGRLPPLRRPRRRQPLPRPRHADPAGRGRLHGERLDAGAPPRLRRAAPHPERDRRAGAGAGGVTGFPCQAGGPAQPRAVTSPTCARRRSWSRCPDPCPRGPRRTSRTSGSRTRR